MEPEFHRKGFPLSRQALFVGEEKMGAQRIIAIVLLAAGALGLAYGGFTYTKGTHNTDIGPLHLSVDEKHYVDVPVWLGVGAMVLGGLLLVVGRKN